MACLVRVPMEVVKQRRQTHPANKSSLRIALAAYKYEGIRKVRLPFYFFYNLGLKKMEK